MEVLIFETEVAALWKVSKVDMVEPNYLPIARMYSILLKNLRKLGNLTAACEESLNKLSEKVGGAADREAFSFLLEMLCHERIYLE